jgi:hypothetical protein
MCARIFYLILAAVVTFNLVAIIAFVYLPWWQALITVLFTVVAMVLAGKYLIRYFFRNLLNMSTEMLSQQARVLKNATVAVHSIQPAEIPEEVRQLLNDAQEDADPDEQEENIAQFENVVWRQIELTIFPDISVLQPGDNAAWQVHVLCLVPLSWNYEDDFDLDEEAADDDGSITIFNVQIIENGEVVQGELDEVQGVQRIRFVAGIPPKLSEVALAYMTEKFGVIKLPTTLPPRIS